MKSVKDFFKKKPTPDANDAKVQAANPTNIVTSVAKIRQVRDARKKQLDEAMKY